MNDKLQYATMLEIPVNTCSITEIPKTNKRGRRKKAVNPESVKQELIKKVNLDENMETNESQVGEQASSEQNRIAEEYTEQLKQGEAEAQTVETAEQEEKVEEQEKQTSATVRSVKQQERAEKPKFKFSVIGVQLAVIAVLAATIFLTNAFYADSGINVFFINQ